ncbi:unnamed protein product [Calypogeia fissa]
MGLPVRRRALGASSGQAGAADSEKQAECRMIRSKGNELQTGGTNREVAGLGHNLLQTLQDLLGVGSGRSNEKIG